MKYKNKLIGVLTLFIAVLSLGFIVNQKVYAFEGQITINDGDFDINLSQPYTYYSGGELMGQTGAFIFQDGETYYFMDLFNNQSKTYIIEDGVVVFELLHNKPYTYYDDGDLQGENGAFIFSDATNYIFLANNNTDGKRPAISGEEIYVTVVDDAKPLSFFQAFLSAYDETDGDLTDQIYVITDNYTANRSVLGLHKVVFGVKDKAGNEAILEAYIKVVDNTKPIITGNSAKVKVGYKETYNIENFRKTLVATDNYDNLTNADIKIKTDNYTANKNKLGNYEIIFSVKDTSGNEGIFTKPIEVYDNIKPTFSGPTNIATSNSTILTESEIRAQLTAHDEIDGNLTARIELLDDNFTGKGNKVGTYTITYKVTDNAGNSTTHTVTINRNDNLPPVIWIQDGVSIRTNPSIPLTHDQIIDILIATNQVTNDTTTQFNVMYDEYTGNEAEPGIYAMTIRARSVSGNESLHNLAITVLESTDEEPITKTPGQNIFNWVKDNPAWTTVIVLSVIIIPLVFIKRKKK